MAAFGSNLGTWLEHVGMQWVVARTTGSMLWMSYLATAQLLPLLVLGLVGGLVTDRVNRRTLLVVTQACMLVIALGMAAVVLRLPSDLTAFAQKIAAGDPQAVALAGSTNGLLLALAAAQGVTMAFSAPAWQVLTPRLVPREELTRAITLQGIQFNIARSVGPALGGVLIYQAGAASLFIINAVAFIGVMAAVLKTPDAPIPPEQRARWLDLRRAFDQTAEAIRWTCFERGPRAILLACVLFCILGTPIIRFLPLFVSEVYGEGSEAGREKVFGLLLAVQGVGCVAGGFALRWVPHWYPKHHLIPLSVMLGGVFILIFSLADSAVLAAPFMFFVGVFWMWTFNSCMAAMQTLVPDALRGRAMAVLNTAAMGLMPIGNYLASAIGALGQRAVLHTNPELWSSGLGTQIGVGALALILVATGVVMTIWRTPEVDGPGPVARRAGFFRGITAANHRPATPGAPPRPADAP